MTFIDEYDIGRKEEKRRITYRSQASGMMFCSRLLSKFNNKNVRLFLCPLIGYKVPDFSTLDFLFNGVESKHYSRKI